MKRFTVVYVLYARCNIYNLSGNLVLLVFIGFVIFFLYKKTVHKHILTFFYACNILNRLLTFETLACVVRAVSHSKAVSCA